MATTHLEERPLRMVTAWVDPDLARRLEEAAALADRSKVRLGCGLPCVGISTELMTRRRTMFGKAKGEPVIYGGALGMEIKSPFPQGVLAFLQPHEQATPETLERARAYWPEAQLADFEVSETGPDKWSVYRQGVRQAVPTRPLGCPAQSESEGERHRLLRRRCRQSSALPATPRPAALIE